MSRSVGGWARGSDGRTKLQEDQDENTMQPDENPEPDELLQAEKPSKRHRITKWLRRTFEWCVDALSFRCLRVAAGSSQPVSADFYGFELGSEVVPQSGPSPFSYVPDFLHVDQADVEEDFIFLDEPLDAAPLHEDSAGALNIAPVYEPPDANDDDDLDMRIARQAAAEIEWYNEAAKPRAPLTTQPKSGAWSKEEHERYYEGIEIYRFGSWKLIAKYVGTRTVGQVRSHAQSVRAKRKRVEEREKGHSNTRHTGANKSARLTTATPNILSPLSSARSRKMTPEELLLASMANSTISSSITEHPNNVYWQMMVNRHRMQL